MKCIGNLLMFLTAALLLVNGTWGTWGTWGTGGTAFAAEDHAGSVKSFKEPAWIVRNGEKIDVEMGTRLFSGDVLKTGRGGAMGIIFQDDTCFSMGPQSEFVLNEFVFQPKQRRFSLVGKMVRGTFSYLSGLIGKLSPESTKLETPVGALGIRGTRFFAKVDG